MRAAPGQRASGAGVGGGGTEEGENCHSPYGESEPREGVDGRSVPHDGDRPTDELSREPREGKPEAEAAAENTAQASGAVPASVPGPALPPAGDTASGKDLPERRPPFKGRGEGAKTALAPLAAPHLEGG